MFISRVRVRPTRSEWDALGTKKAVLVASTGGHLAQLFRIEEILLKFANEPLWITFDNEQSRSLLAGKRVRFVRYVRSRGWKDLIGALPATVKALRSEKPDVVISTGAALALIALPIAVLMRKEVHYIESVSRFDGPSLTGRVLARVPGIHLHAQHPEWATERWTNDVSVLDEYVVSGEVRTQTNLVPKIFVTLGTIRPYRFDALVDRILTICPADAEFTWQLGVTTRTDLPGDVHISMSVEDMDQAITESDFVISHAGVGTALRAMDLGRCAVLVPRRASKGEHVDDHQVQITKALSERGLAIGKQVTDLTLLDLERASSIQLTRQSGV